MPECQNVQEILSAAADGEETDTIAVARARRHAQTCPECSALLLFTDGETRPVFPSPGPVLRPVPRWLGAFLWVAGIFHAAVGLPMLFGVTPGTITGVAAAHITRDGAIACTVATICVAIAVRPRWAPQLGWPAGGLLILQLLGTVADLADGDVVAGFEAIHLITTITTAVIVWSAWWLQLRIE